MGFVHLSSLRLKRKRGVPFNIPRSELGGDVPFAERYAGLAADTRLGRAGKGRGGASWGRARRARARTGPSRPTQGGSQQPRTDIPCAVGHVRHTPLHGARRPARDGGGTHRATSPERTSLWHSREVENPRLRLRPGWGPPVRKRRPLPCCGGFPAPFAPCPDGAALGPRVDTQTHT